VDSQLAPPEWPLEALATKMKQYCYLLEDLTAQVLQEQADGDYELLRDYLKRRAVDAFWQKVCSGCSLQYFCFAYQLAHLVSGCPVWAPFVFGVAAEGLLEALSC